MNATVQFVLYLQIDMYSLEKLKIIINFQIFPNLSPLT